MPRVFGRGSRSQPAALVSDRDDAALFPAIRIRPVTVRVWATAPQFCGLKILRDSHPRLYRSPLFGSGIRRNRRRGARRRLKRGNSSAAALAARAAHRRVSDRKIAARCPDVPSGPDRMLTVARLPRFYNKFRLQSDRSTTNSERAADRKLTRL